MYPSLLLFPFNLICYMTMFRKLNFWPLPKAPGGGDQKNCAGACVIHVSNSHTKSGWISEKNLFDPQPPMVPPIIFWPPGHPSAPSPTPEAWPRWQNENLVWYILYLSFVRTHPKFGIKIFEIDFVIEIKWYLTFWPRPRAQGGWAKKNLPLHAPFMWVTQSPNLVEFRQMV